MRGFRRRAKAGRGTSSGALFGDGELVTVRAYAGSRAEEEPRAVVVGGREVPVDAVEWRAVVEQAGDRRRVFIVRLGGSRIRLAHIESSSMWEVERTLPPLPEPGNPPGVQE